MTGASLRQPAARDVVDGHVELDDFRHALRRLGGGVTIVATTDLGGRPRGLMMTAVMSLSFSPPSMLIAVNQAASALPALLERRCFSISLVGAGDEAMCRAFAAADAESRFVSEHWDQHWKGVPVYRHAIASIVCDIDDTQDFGTHAIIRGLVRAAAYAPCTAGLIHLDGQFCRAVAGE